MWTDSMLGLRKLWSWLTGLLGGDEAVEDRVVRREEARLQNDSSGNDSQPDVPAGIDTETAEEHNMSGDEYQKREHSLVLPNLDAGYVLELEYDDWEVKQQMLADLPMHDPRRQVRWAYENDHRYDGEITVWTDQHTKPFVTEILDGD